MTLLTDRERNLIWALATAQCWLASPSDVPRNQRESLYRARKLVAKTLDIETRALDADDVRSRVNAA